MKIYTKRGDLGMTSTFGGTELHKSNILVNAYGDVDELNANLALVASLFQDSMSNFLISIQDYLFVIGSHLATDSPEFKHKLPPLYESKTLDLELMIDKMESELPKMTHFILPGKSFETGLIHVARTVCRRAERSVVEASLKNEINPLIIQYLNRLSDFLFVLSRYKAKLSGEEEIKWNVKN
ncbi:MAG: cob(I)yrinic acid a,c-diamide adenosyltransferase [Cytophagales bacterium]